MQLHKRLLFTCCIAISLLAACHPGLPPPVVTGATPTPEQRELATLAFLAYLGDAVTGSDESVERDLAHCMGEALREQEGVERWELAWGPAVYHFSLGKLDDNMMYAVRDKSDPAHVVVVVRGTNPDSVLDWLVEDFDVVDQVPWPGGEAPAGTKTSKAISEGLQILRSMTPEAGPAPGEMVTDFLQSEVNKYPQGLRLDVTGHSLGGALSPALALLLSETLTGKVQISVLPLAGPTPGNAEFAAYYYNALGSSTQRLWNPFDVVPLAWNHETMGKMEDLYEPFTRAEPTVRGLIDGLRSIAKDGNYTQITTQPSLSGAVSTNPKPGERADWLNEAGWQHHCGYQCAMGISVLSSVPGEGTGKGGVAGCPSKGPQYLCPPNQCPKNHQASIAAINH